MGLTRCELISPPIQGRVGGVTAGSNITITSDGVISASQQTAPILSIQAGTGISVADPQGPSPTISNLGVLGLVDGTNTSVRNIGDGTWAVDATSGSSGVNSIIAGSPNVTLDPPSGQGDVTISVTGGGTGTVQEVNTGAGLSGGPITSTGTISIADGGIVNSMVSDVAGIDSVKSSYTATLTGAVSRTVRAKLGDFLSFKDFGAVGDGVTDNRQAWANAVNAINAAGGGSLYIPAGTYRVVSDNTSSAFTVPFSIFGEGRTQSVLYYDETGTSTRADFLVAGVPNPLDGDINLFDFGIRGSWGENGDYTQKSQMMELVCMGNITLMNLHLSRSTYFSAPVGNYLGAPNPCKSVVAIGNLVESCPGDGISVRGTIQTIVIGNRFVNVNDDCVACHTVDAETAPIQSYAVIANNNAVDSQGITCLGAMHTVITGNSITRAAFRAIMVEAAGVTGFPEGNNNSFSVNISNNVIDTVFSGSAFSPLSANGVNYISLRIGNISAVGGYYPGGSNGSGGVSSPSAYFYSQGVPSATAASTGAYSYVISNNICMRSLEPVAQYTDYGFGQRLGRSGPSNPAITPTTLGYSGDSAHFYLQGGLNNVSLCNNVSWGAYKGVNIIAGGTTTPNLIDVSINGNSFVNYGYVGVQANGRGVIEIRNNLFDGDPLCSSPLRGANGTWAAASQDNFAAVWQANPEAGVSFVGNSIKNVAQVYMGPDPSLILANNNTLYANPVAAVSNSNVGIRSINIPVAGQSNSLVVLDGNPTSATFCQVLNTCLVASSSVPTAGKYLTGMFVANSNPSVSGTAGSRYTVQGWSRLTNGSGHVLNTDWAEVRALTGT